MHPSLSSVASSSFRLDAEVHAPLGQVAFKDLYICRGLGTTNVVEQQSALLQNGSLLVLVRPPWLALTLGTLARDFFLWKITYRFFGPGPVWSLVRPYQLSIKKGEIKKNVELLHASGH